MKRIILILTVFFFIGVLISIFSCAGGPFDCGPFNNKFKVIDLNWHYVEVTQIDTVQDIFLYDETTKDSIAYNHFGITIVPYTESYSSNIHHVGGLSPFQSAMACSPPELTTDETVESIEITCNHDFNPQFKAGENLAPLFNVLVYDYYSSYTYELMDLQDYTQKHMTTPQILVLLLKEPPTHTRPVSFTVKYKQNGIEYDQFEYTLLDIVIMPYRHSNKH